MSEKHDSAPHPSNERKQVVLPPTPGVNRHVSTEGGGVPSSGVTVIGKPISEREREERIGEKAAPTARPVAKQ